MKRLFTLSMMFLLSLSACNSKTIKNVIKYEIAFMTSEVQEETHDIKLAQCEDNIFIKIPFDFNSKNICVKQSDNVVYYWINSDDDIFIKVSDKGWKYCG